MTLLRSAIVNSVISNTLQKLVDRFEKNESEYTNSASTYNESETRNDFINEFFILLGWDVLNVRGLPRPLREVILEANVDVNEQTKKPDYELRNNGIRKFFVEAKKPAIDIKTSKEASFQSRRYGWSAKLPISVLTNFKDLVIYDCYPLPSKEDDPRVAVIKQYHYKEFVKKFDEIYSLISKEAVISGEFDSKFNILPEDRKGEKPFDNFFLEQIEKWRLKLAKDLIKNNPKLKIEELNYLIQIFINRIVFLRICEDRNLEQYGALKKLAPNQAVKELLGLFYEADRKYNSGLFDFIKDKLSPSVKLSDDVLLGVVQDLYYPNSPYTFSVVEPKLLGDIYDQFISKVVQIDKNGNLTIETKPEVKAAHGIFITPYYIVKEIIHKSFKAKLGNDPKIESLNQLKVLDPSCGSGIFLVEAYRYLLDCYLEIYLKNDSKEHIRQDDNGDHFLSLEEKRRILSDHIFGVDIDEQAVEVAKFSLLIKVLEDIPKAEIDVEGLHHKKALPSLENNLKSGNSLIDESYIRFRKPHEVKEDEFHTIKPFEWNNAFPNIFNGTRNGFDIIVGNPPYTKIQNIVQYLPKESEFYKSDLSPYISSKSNNFDKYQLFIERSIHLLNNGGVLGYIVPHKFMTIKAGEPLREILSTSRYIQEITHFGILQVFGSQSTTYTCILILRKENHDNFNYEQVSDLLQWENRNDENTISISSDVLSKSPWTFPNKQQKEIFDKIENELTLKLQDIAEIFVGLQTSADNIYFVNPTKDTTTSIIFKDENGREWSVEKELFKDAILDQSIHYFQQLQNNRLILFPYKEIDGANVILSEEDIKKEYPKTFNYLLSFKEDLLKRDLGSNPIWYQYGRSQSLNKFSTPKLIIKNPSLFACVAYDWNNIMFTGGGNGPYYGIRPKNDLSIFTLQAIINHPLFDAWVKLRSSVFRGGYYSFGRQFIINFPVFDINDDKNKSLLNEIQVLWKRINQLNGEDMHTPRRVEEIRRQKEILKMEADGKIYKLYSIDPDTIKNQSINEND